MPEVILVTGGAGFIGSSFVRHILEMRPGLVVLNLDALTYAGSTVNLIDLRPNHNHILVHGDIADRELVARLLRRYQPSAVIHFAAETHVDRSIRSPEQFVRTNIVGTFELLQASLGYWQHLDSQRKECFRFLQISTDEVYGSAKRDGRAFTEDTAYAPNSPYSASKASADHLVRAYHHTYDLPTLGVTPCNNYGPNQYPEKLIPLMILNALVGLDLPIYADGANVRDWLYVQDNCRAILAVIEGGRPGETYNVGGRTEKSNIDVVHAICKQLEISLPAQRNQRLQRRGVQDYVDLIRFVEDRPGHDQRYAIDPTKIETELGWRPLETFETGLEKTVSWYLHNNEWCQQICDDYYRAWLERNYATRRKVSHEGDHPGRGRGDAPVPAHAGRL